MICADPFVPFARLAENAATSPDRAAIITPDRRITHQDLADLVAGRAMWLLEQGFDAEAMTAVTVPDEVEHLLMSLALLCLGTRNISLGSHEPEDIRSRLALQLGVRQVVSGHGIGPLPEVAGFLPPSGALPAGTRDLFDRMDRVARGRGDKVFFASTSGTTGLPKLFGVSMALFLEMTDLIAAEPWRACVLRNSSVEFHSSRLHQLAMCLAGRTAAILDPVTADRLAPFCAMAGVTEIQTGTYRLSSLLAVPPDPRHRLPEGLRILTGGSRVSGALRAAIRTRLTPNLWVNYATSEVGVISIAGPDLHDAWPEGVGFPRSGVEVSLRDADGNDVARGELGEAWVKKAGVEGWFRTGDLLTWPEDGPLIFQSRRDDMMILNGINIFPSSIEDALLAHPAVGEALAYPIASAVHGQIPAAVVVLKPDAVVTEADLLTYARGILRIRAPRQITLTDAIPRTHLGKPRAAAFRSR